MPLQLGRDGDLPGDAGQRVFRRQIAVRRREQGRPLDVRVVVRAADRHAHQADVQRRQQVEEAERLRQVGADAAAVAAEGVAIGAGERLRLAAAVRPLAEGDPVHGAEADADRQARRLGADAGDDFAEKARPVLETAAVAAGPVHGAEELVAEVAVAVLDVDEVEAGPLRRRAAWTKSSTSRAISSSVSTGWPSGT